MAVRGLLAAAAILLPVAAAAQTTAAPLQLEARIPLGPVSGRDFGRFEARSALLGGIWQVRENLAFDIGLRGGTIHDHSLAEVRAGLTFNIAVSTHPNQEDRP